MCVCVCVWVISSLCLSITNTNDTHAHHKMCVAHTNKRAGSAGWFVGETPVVFTFYTTGRWPDKTGKCLVVRLAAAPIATSGKQNSEFTAESSSHCYNIPLASHSLAPSPPTLAPSLRSLPLGGTREVLFYRLTRLLVTPRVCRTLFERPSTAVNRASSSSAVQASPVKGNVSRTRTTPTNARS